MPGLRFPTLSDPEQLLQAEQEWHRKLRSHPEVSITVACDPVTPALSPLDRHFLDHLWQTLRMKPGPQHSGRLRLEDPRFEPSLGNSMNPYQKAERARDGAQWGEPGFHPQGVKTWR